MSVTPSPVTGASSSDETTSPAIVLRLVPRHEHTWALRAVEFDDGLEVRRYECGSCDDVQFR